MLAEGLLAQVDQVLVRSAGGKDTQLASAAAACLEAVLVGERSQAQQPEAAPSGQVAEGSEVFQGSVMRITFQRQVSSGGLLLLLYSLRCSMPQRLLRECR